MFTFLIVLSVVVSYLVMIGITYGYGKHRWPPLMVKRWSYKDAEDDNEFQRVIAAVFWPFYWTFIWPVTKASEVTFDQVEKHAAKQIARNKVRIADLHATREELAKSNAELEEAELELEKETAKL